MHRDPGQGVEIVHAAVGALHFDPLHGEILGGGVYHNILTTKRRKHGGGGGGGAVEKRASLFLPQVDMSQISVSQIK